MLIPEKYKRKLRKIVGIASLGAITIVNNGCNENHSDNTDRKVPQTEKSAVRKPADVVVKNPVLTIKYRTDTLYERTSTLLYYSNKKITRNYVEGCNSFRLQLPYFSHEKWHEHNFDLGFRTRYLTSPVEYAKLCLHDEISANLAAILTMRYEYLAAQDKDSIVKKYENTYAGFYFKAIKEKKINPLSKDSVENDKEYRFLANGVMDMWMRLYYPVYAPKAYKMMKDYVKRKGLVEDSKGTYSYLKKRMYIIGGIEFAKYLEKDIDYYYNDYVNIIENLRKVKSLQAGNKEILPEIEKNYKLVQTLDYNLQEEAFQHLLISAQLKYKLRGIDAFNLKQHPQIIASCYNQIVKKMEMDKTFKEFMENTPVRHSLIYEKGEKATEEYQSVLPFRVPSLFPIRGKATEKYQSVLQQMYTLNGVDLHQEIENFDEHYIPIRINSTTMNSWQKVEMDLGFYVGIFEQEQENIRKTSRNDDNAAPQVTISGRPQRLSDEQLIDIPNFYEPILLANTPEQNEQIFAMLRKFDSLPDVLKNCDTKAQQEFLKKYKKEKSK